MTTRGPGLVSETETGPLTEMILRGEEENAARLAAEISQRGQEANEIVDAIADAMNIVVDLHEVEKYSIEQVESCERAAEKALQAISPRIRVEQTKISGRVMVTSLAGDPHSFDKTLLLTMLKIGGFTALDGGSGLSPQEVVQAVVDLKPDILAVPLVTATAAESLRDATPLMSGTGWKPRIVAYGRGAGSLPLGNEFEAVEEDPLRALSRIAELLISRT